MFHNHITVGIIAIIGGIALILVSAFFKAVGIPDIFLGFYTGPLVVIVGGGILIAGKDKEK